MILRICAAAFITFFSLTSFAEPAAPLTKAHAWVMGFLLEASPPGRKIWYPEGQETKDEALQRYNRIAWDVVELAYAPETTPVFSSTIEGRSQTATVWLGVMFFESSFMKHVDYNLGEKGRGDSGLSWCMMQLRIGAHRTVPWNIKEDRQPWFGDNPEDIFEGYTGLELIEDRKRCINEGHHMIRASFKLCNNLPLMERLTAYAIGRCVPKNEQDPEDVKEVALGRSKSRSRMSSAIKYFTKTKDTRGFTDDEVVAAMETTRRRDRLALFTR